MKLLEKQWFWAVIILIIFAGVFGISYYLGIKHQVPATKNTTSSSVTVTPAQSSPATPSATTTVSETPTNTPTPTQGIVKLKTPLQIFQLATSTPTPTPTMGIFKNPIKYYPITTP